jgi:hypothetical protein
MRVRVRSAEQEFDDLARLAVSDFMEYEDELLFTNATGYVNYFDKDATTFDGTAISAFWETPWQDLDAYRVTKTTDELYFYASGHGVLRVDVTFDSKTKTKNVTLVSTGKLHTLRSTLMADALR